MKKAIITTGNKQYLVSEGDIIDVDLLADAQKFSPEVLLMISDAEIKVGKPTVEGAKVVTEIVEPLIKAEKVLALRYKAKKRVHTIRGSRKQLTRIKITKIG